jgi:hypothetical protein
MTLQRIVLDFRSGELLVRCLYRTNRGPNPGTKARQREVQELTRSGLQDALDALEGRVDVVGVSGYDVREDTLSLPVPMSLPQQGGPPREALSFLCATANVCVPSSEGRVAEPMGYPIIDRGLRHDRGSRRRACREGRARNRLHRELARELAVQVLS